MRLGFAKDMGLFGKSTRYSLFMMDLQKNTVR
jgi:hypothetical protein